MKVSLARLLFLGVLAEIIILGVSYALHPEEGETFRYASRYSGRLSALVFLLSFYLFVIDDSSIDREEIGGERGSSFLRYCMSSTLGSWLRMSISILSHLYL